MSSLVSGRTTFKRRAIRCLAVTIICVMVLDTLPHSWAWLAQPKRLLTFVLNRVGLWQGEWPMFAPDPVINNGWFTAEMLATDGTMTQWDSPYWSEASGWDKFVRFRHVDFYNRLGLTGNYPARGDFIAYLARRATKPLASVKLYRNQMRIQMPEDGSLPPREEIQWMFTSELLARRSFQP